MFTFWKGYNPQIHQNLILVRDYRIAKAIQSCEMLLWIDLN